MRIHSCLLMGVVLLIAGACGSEEFAPVQPLNFDPPFLTPNTNLQETKAFIKRLHNVDMNQIDALVGEAASLPAGATIALLGEQVQAAGNHWETSVIKNYRVRYEGVDLCRGQVKALKMRHSDNLAVFGTVPEIHDVASSEWLEADEARQLASSAVRSRGFGQNSLIVADTKNCFAARDGRLFPIWQISVVADDLLFKTEIGSHGVIDVTPVSFDVSAQATVYESNPNTDLKTFKLNQMSADGTLENTYFTISTTGTAVQESDLDFAFDPTDEADQFQQTSMFVHTNVHYDWFRDKGHEWGHDSKLTLVAHAVINGSINNALYTPPTSVTPARIQVGDGDGVRLANLPEDGDVSKHELGHDIVYYQLKEVKGASLTIHEGLADFFTFAATGDPCLGESICPVGSDVNCEIDGQCLRTADNEYVLGENTKSEPHFKSQFLSGMLWDLRGNEIPEDTLDQVVYGGVQLLLEASGYHDFVLGLLLADEDLNNGQYCQDILDKADERGLAEFISSFSCDGDLPDLNALDNGGEDTSTATNKRSSSTDDGFCAVVSGNKGNNGPWGFIFLLLLPLVLPILGRAARSTRS